MQLSKYTPTETGGVSPNVPWLRLTLAGADVPAGWLLTGFAFGGDGYGYITINTGGVRGLYRFLLSDGVLVKVNPVDVGYAAHIWYDAASCVYPALTTSMSVEKTGRE